ncbi:hypothetical protein I552_10271 [Mycobacterium xenopi 3993]|nr:hypothetical protein I552_10271 [Mycobacterium xenopi 3993]
MTPPPSHSRRGDEACRSKPFGQMQPAGTIAAQPNAWPLRFPRNGTERIARRHCATCIAALAGAPGPKVLSLPRCGCRHGGDVRRADSAGAAAAALKQASAALAGAQAQAGGFAAALRQAIATLAGTSWWHSRRSPKRTSTARISLCPLAQEVAGSR